MFGFTKDEALLFIGDALTNPDSLKSLNENLKITLPNRDFGKICKESEVKNSTV